MSLRSYEDAINHLNTLQTNASILQQIRASGGLVNSLAIPEMVEYLERIGYTVRSIVPIAQPLARVFTSCHHRPTT
jgi:folylpolyglutamate synthase